jgi:endonuclease YncB( thermonuclease family)
VGSLDVNTAQVSQGMTWVYRQYNRDKSLLALEQEAKNVKRGCGQSLTQYRPGSTGMAAEQAPQ